MKKNILIILLLWLNCAVWGQNGNKCRYWFDGNLESQQTVSLTGLSWKTEIVVNNLQDGIHSIHFQAEDANGTMSPVVSKLFAKYSKSDGYCRYWFDDGFTNAVTVKKTTGQFDIDVSALDYGLHTLHIFNGKNAVSPTESRMFMIMPMSIDVADTNEYNYWFDDDISNMRSLTGGSTIIDVKDLTDGLHSIHISLGEGALVPTVSCLFMKTPEVLSSTANAPYVCWIDDDFEHAQEMVSTQGSFIIDTNGLSEGLHAFHVKAGGSVSTSTSSSLFMKLSSENDVITHYEYWVNDGEATLKTLTTPQRTLSLIELLPLEHYPLRSCNFHFAVENLIPYMYAKNDIRFRFHNSDISFADSVKQYVDYSVKKKISKFISLLPDQEKTISKPADNDVAWFKMTAKRGDSLSVKTDKACTLQLFSPSGAELYSISGAEAVDYGGCHATEDGTYYLALHDVTSTTGEDVSVSYQHIDKYAVLSYTPDEVGVFESFVGVSLEGNGFDKLVSAALQYGNNTIWARDLESVTKSRAVLKFALEGTEKTGKYNLILNFKDEDEEESLTIDKALSLTKADIGKVMVDISSSGSFLSEPYIVTVKVTNTGNTSLLYVPFNIATTWGYQSLGFLNFKVLEPVNGNGGESTYQPWADTDNLLGTGVPGSVFYYFIPRLGPHESREYILGFGGQAGTTFDMYAWTGTPLNAPRVASEQDTNIPSVWEYLSSLKALTKSNANHSKLRAVDYEGLNNALSVADKLDKSGYASQAGRLAVANGMAMGGLINGLRRAQLDMYDDPDGYLDDYKNKLEEGMPTPGQIMGTAGVPDELIPAAEAMLGGKQSRQASIQTPKPVKTPIAMVTPVDPNDIIGYTAESGSHFVRKDKKKVFFTIEFENDPKMATAAAHTIVIRDTLDSKVYDLSSFEATEVNIGNKRMMLNGEKQFVKTMDLRTNVDVIAQVELNFDERKGIATWTIKSLDPMTLEPTTSATQGALPVNRNGTGQGEVSFNIALKDNLADGKEMKNRGAIVFDNQPAILTPYWVNHTDYTFPVSVITSESVQGNNSVFLRWSGTDEGSGIWKYNVYAKSKDSDNVVCLASGTELTENTFELENASNYNFIVEAIDLAGNIEVVNIGDDGISTGIKEISADDANANVYDISGRRVLSTYQKGVYIKGRKKIVRK